MDTFDLADYDESRISIALPETSSHDDVNINDDSNNKNILSNVLNLTELNSENSRTLYTIVDDNKVYNVNYASDILTTKIEENNNENGVNQTLNCLANLDQKQSNSIVENDSLINGQTFLDMAFSKSMDSLANGPSNEYSQTSYFNSLNESIFVTNQLIDKAAVNLNFVDNSKIAVNNIFNNPLKIASLNRLVVENLPTDIGEISEISIKDSEELHSTADRSDLSDDYLNNYLENQHNSDEDNDMLSFDSTRIYTADTNHLNNSIKNSRSNSTYNSSTNKNPCHSDSSNIPISVDIGSEYVNEFLNNSVLFVDTSAMDCFKDSLAPTSPVSENNHDITITNFEIEHIEQRLCSKTEYCYYSDNENNNSKTCLSSFDTNISIENDNTKLQIVDPHSLILSSSNWDTFNNSKLKVIKDISNSELSECTDINIIPTSSQQSLLTNPLLYSTMDRSINLLNIFPIDFKFDNDTSVIDSNVIQNANSSGAHTLTSPNEKVALLSPSINIDKMDDFIVISASDAGDDGNITIEVIYANDNDLIFNKDGNNNDDIDDSEENYILIDSVTNGYNYVPIINDATESDNNVTTNGITAVNQTTDKERSEKLVFRDLPRNFGQNYLQDKLHNKVPSSQHHANKSLLPYQNIDWIKKHLKTRSNDSDNLLMQIIPVGQKSPKKEIAEDDLSQNFSNFEGSLIEKSKKFGEILSSLQATGIVKAYSNFRQLEICHTYLHENKNLRGGLDISDEKRFKNTTHPKLNSLIDIKNFKKL